MPALDSDKVKEQLKNKLGCTEENGKDHYKYVLKNEQGKILSATKVSLGAKHAIGPHLLSLMTRQIRLGKAANFVGMVNCSKTREECLAIIRSLAGL